MSEFPIIKILVLTYLFLIAYAASALILSLDIRIKYILLNKGVYVEKRCIGEVYFYNQYVLIKYRGWKWHIFKNMCYPSDTADSDTSDTDNPARIHTWTELIPHGRSKMYNWQTRSHDQL